MILWCFGGVGPPSRTWVWMVAEESNISRYSANSDNFEGTFHPSVENLENQSRSWGIGPVPSFARAIFQY